MGGILKKTLKDLEFPVVLQQVASRCNTNKGKLAALEIVPLSTVEDIQENLGVTSEYLASFSNENRIPNHGFEEIDEELKLLEDIQENLGVTSEYLAARHRSVSSRRSRRSS